MEQSHQAATAIQVFSFHTKHILKIRSEKCHELFEREIANLRYSANAYYLPLSYWASRIAIAEREIKLWPKSRLSKLSHLKNCEVFQDAVLHVSFWQVFEFQDKVDHIFTHWGSVEFVNEPTVLKSCILRLNLLHNLFSKAANFCWALNGHILGALVPEKDYKLALNRSDGFSIW